MPADLPLPARLALASLVFVVGAVKVYQLLTPARALAVLPLSEREKRLARLKRAPLPLVWGAAVTTGFFAVICFAPLWSLGLLECWSGSLRALAVALLGPAYASEAADIAGPVGPAAQPPPWWALAAAAAGVLLPAAMSYFAWRLRRRGSAYSGLLVGIGGVCVLCTCGLPGTAAVRDVAGITYRNALRHWVRRVSPVSPEDVAGRKGPVVLYARPSIYREVDPGILYRRKMQVGEHGAVVPREEIFPFHVGKLAVQAFPGEQLVVAGVQPAYEGVIVTQEPLRIGGYLAGFLLEARKPLCLYIAPADYRDWRQELEALWGSVHIGQRVLPPVYLAGLLLCGLWALGVLADCLGGCVFHTFITERAGKP